MEGVRLGSYRIDRELGSGGMGKVYAATGPDGVVALKVVHPHLLETPGFFKRFMREAQLGQAIRHENVVRTLDCDQDFAGGRPQCFLVMEYVEGQTLADLLRELERVPEELCRHVAREICKGLAAVHDAGVVHRDLKPENVIVATRAARRRDDVAGRPTSRASGDGGLRAGNARDDVEYVVKIMDLGVAQVADEALRLSKSGAFVGSVEYAAPEQFKGGDVDGRTDLHALGVLLYELSSGVHPYRGGGFHEAMHRVCDSEPRRLGEINPQLSPFLEEVVHTLLVKDPRGRFASATQLLAVLEDGEDSDWWHERARRLQADTKRPLRRIRIPRETAVYGREKELERLRGLFEKAKAGDGQVVLIEGEAGIGKSRLVDELIARLQADGEDVNFLFGSYPPGGAATASGAFSAAYREHLGEAGCADYLGHLQLLAPAFEALLHGGTPPSGGEPLTKDSLQTCFVTVTRSLAAERVTVVLIDDLHFAPDEGRGLFSSLAMAVPGARVLLVGTTRPGVSGEWTAGLTRLEQTSQIPVDRLSPKDLIELLRDSFRSEELAIGLAGQIALKSDGNPFFAFEIIRGLREGQFITQRDDGTWASTRIIDEIRIPSSVLDLVNARVAGLSEDERALLDVAACWGYEFDPGLVGEVLGLPRIPTLRAFGQIERQHRLVRAAGRTMVFDHHQVQEALYGSLLEQLREEYHAALAEVLETRVQAAEKDPRELDGALCVDLCEHYLKGARGASALRYLEAAQAHLQKGYLGAQVIALTERALGVPGLLTGPERVRALLLLADALNLQGRRARQEECAREAERLAEDAGDDDLRGQAACTLGTLFWRTSRHGEAEAAYARGRELARARGDRSAEAAASGGLGNVCASVGRFAEALQHHERHLELSRGLGQRKAEALATLNLGSVFLAQGRLSEAREKFEQNLAMVRELGDRAGEARATGSLGSVYLTQGRLAESQECHERALALFREIGDRPGEFAATGNLGIVFRTRGCLAEALEHHERYLSLCREMGDRASEAGASVNLGGALLSLGRLPEARQRLERALALTREIGHRPFEANASGGMGAVLRAQGRLAEAEEIMERGLALQREIGNPHGEAIALVNLGSIQVELGDTQRARASLEASLALCHEIGAREPEGYGLLDLGVLSDAEGDVVSARQYIEQSLAIRRELDYGEGIADSLIALGEVLLHDGESAQARAALAEALQLSREQGRQASVAEALCVLARLPGGDSEAALAALPEGGDARALCRMRLHLWKATGERAHLREAKSLLDEQLANVPAEYHVAMCRNVRVNREILAAWSGEGAADASLDDDEPHGTESLTRVG